VNLADTPPQAALRAQARAWLIEHLEGSWEHVRGRGGPGDEHAAFEDRRAWERELANGRWTCLSWPAEYGGRGATLAEQIIFYEEYARAGGPGRVGIVGEGLLGPTIVALGTGEQRERFLPPIVAGTELWCQGYSEPNAGSDLANVATRAVRDGDEWVITGQKVWTSLAHWADWCFALARTDPDADRHRGLSYLLVPMRQDGIEIRPIRQLTGTSEFNEVFFDGARTPVAHTVGAIDDGWNVAMATLAYERGALTLGQQLAFARELDGVIADARERGRADDPVLRNRLADAWVRVQLMRIHALRSLPALERGEVTRETAISKLYWANLHRDLGQLAVEVLGPDAEIADAGPYELSATQKLFLYTRADTIYGGSNEIQRNVIGERVLGLPREPR